MTDSSGVFRLARSLPRRPAALLLGGVLALAGCTSAAPLATRTSPATSSASSTAPSTAPASSSLAPPPSSASPSATASSPAVAPTTTLPPGPGSPLTGQPGCNGSPVVAVKIDNTPNGRPQSGIDDADVVYLEQVESGITRAMGIFCSTLPTRVGPTRSARTNDMELLAEYGHIGLAFSGANRGVLTDVRAANLADLEGAAGYSRDTSRKAPYNLYVNLQAAVKGRSTIAGATDVGFRFGAALPGGRPANSLAVPMSGSVTETFTWQPSTGRYLESIGGKPILAAGGEQVWTTNVLVQSVEVGKDKYVDVNGSHTPYSHTVGTGKFWLLRDGALYTGTWSRPDEKSPTSWTDSSGGGELLAPGRSWVLLMPSARTPKAG